jgi:hypothetical protein
MATLPLANKFDGGTDAAAVTSGNSGGESGTAFTSVTGAPIFDHAQANSGGLSMAVIDPTTNNYGLWSGFGSLTSSVYFRLCLYLTAYPAGSVANILQPINSSAARVCTLQITTTNGFVRTTNAAPSVVRTGAVAVPLNSWFRLEFRVLPSLTVGELEYRLYSTAEGTTIAETFNDTGQVLLASLDGTRLGISTTAPNTPFSVRYDDVAISTTGWIGPPTYTDRAIALQL